MSKSATGSVVDQESGAGIAGLNVDIEDVSQLHDGRVLNKDPFVTDASGHFNLPYASYAFNTTKPGAQARQLRLTIRLGRLVLKQVFQNEDAFGDTVVFDKIVLPRAEAESWRSTLGTGKETRVSTGNAIRWLADNVDAWSRAAQVIRKASTLDVMQLTINVGDFKQNNPIVVMDFDTTDNTSGDNFVILRTDDRIEQTLLDTATKQPVQADVRVQIPRMSLDPNILRDSAIVLTGGAVVFALGAGALFLLGGIVFIFLGILLGAIAGALTIAAYLVPSMPQYFGDWYSKKFEEPDLEKWFKDAAASGVDSSHVRVRQLIYRSFNIAHAKVVLDRGKEAVLLGSPFEQVYFDSPDHAIDSGRRGATASKGPIHDVSAGVRGPALKDFQGLFNSHWKIAEPTETLPDPTAPGPVTAGDGEFNSTVQLVLTLDRMFSGAGEDDGEKGILEVYLRAIHFAKRFIYIENQYFHNPLIVQALIDALTANSQLVVILLLNISPDMPYYLRWQRRGINRIVNALTAKYGKDGGQDALPRVLVLQPCGTGHQPCKAAPHRRLPSHEDGNCRQPVGHGRLGESRRRVDGCGRLLSIGGRWRGSPYGSQRPRL